MQRWHGTHVFDKVRLVDDKKLWFGDVPDVSMYWDGTNNRLTIERATNTLTDPGRQIYASFTATGAVASGKSLTGIQISATFNGTGNNGSVTAAEFKARHTTGNAATVVQLRGLVGNADAKNAVVTTAYAVEGSIDVSAGGTVTTSACFHGNLNNSGTVTTSYGAFLEGISGYQLGIGVQLNYVTKGIVFGAGSVTYGIDFTTLTPTMAASYAAGLIRFGNNGAQKTISLTENWNPIQICVTNDTNPSSEKQMNLIYTKIQTGAAQANARLKCADWNVVVGHNVKAAYVIQTEIDFTAGITVGQEAVALGVVVDAGTNLVTGSLRGIVISMQGVGGMPADARGLEIRCTCTTALAAGISIAGTPQAIVGIQMGDQTNDNEGPVNAFFFPTPAGGDVGPCVNTVASGDGEGSIKIKIGSGTKYLKYWATAS